MSESEAVDLVIRRATLADAAKVGELLYSFNREFNAPTPNPLALTQRVEELLNAGETIILLADDPVDAVSILRFRLAIWSDALECSLAELYVAPPMRGHGVGHALVEASIREARQRGAESLDVATGEGNDPARSLYEGLGFTTGEDGSADYFYQRDLR